MVDQYFGCCGCEAKYFNIIEGKRKTEQVIYSYGCGGDGTPTKFVFNYNKNGKIISCDKYVATVANDQTLSLNDHERTMFAKLDTGSIKINRLPAKFSQITGFRKETGNEKGHGFPLLKNGSGIPVK